MRGRFSGVAIVSARGSRSVLADMGWAWMVGVRWIFSDRLALVSASGWLWVEVVRMRADRYGFGADIGDW